MGSSRNSPSSDFASLPPHAAVCVGFSGGVDSTVLLHLMALNARATGRRVSAVHVHHGLSPNADAWARFCEGFCAERGVPLAIERVAVARDSSEGLEAAARRARYAVYAAREEPIVALAHHRDDQAETVLLQLLRGTGVKGAAAMPEMRELPGSRVSIYRPLLDFSRAELVEFARSAGLAWIEDESNDSRVHDRNYLRHAIAPLLDERFPAWREALARFSRHAASAADLLDALARDDGPDAAQGPWERGHKAMYLNPTLDDARRANALRSFLHRHGLPMPASARLDEMARQLYDARDDATVRIEHADAALVRHRNRAYIESRVHAGAPWRVAWRGEREVDLGEARGHVSFEARSGEGIDPARVGRGEWHFGSRSGGERIRLEPRGATRTLKNLVQERGLSLRERQAFPCLFNDERLVWMSGVGIEADYRVGEGREGLFPSWRMALGTPPVLK